MSSIRRGGHKHRRELTEPLTALGRCKRSALGDRVARSASGRDYTLGVFRVVRERVGVGTSPDGRRWHSVEIDAARHGDAGEQRRSVIFLPHISASLLGVAPHRCSRDQFDALGGNPTVRDGMCEPRGFDQ